MEIDLLLGEHELAVRAWDTAGQTQPALPDDTWNRKGYLCICWHQVRVSVPHPNHAAYCASWAPLLRADPNALATQGSRAADYLTAMQPKAEVLAERSDATGASALVQPSAAATTFLDVSLGSAPIRAANQTRATANRQ